MRVRLELDPETTRRLVEAAGREKRPLEWQAEVILRRGLGLPFPASTGAEHSLRPADAKPGTGGGRHA